MFQDNPRSFEQLVYRAIRTGVSIGGEYFPPCSH